MPKRFLKAVLVGVGILFFFLLVCLGFGIWIYNDFPSHFAARRISEIVSKQTVWKMEMTTIDPFPLGQLHLGPLQIFYPDGRRFLELKGVQLKYWVPTLTSLKEFKIAELSVDSPSISYFPKSFPPSKGSTAFDLEKFKTMPIENIGRELSNLVKHELESSPSITLDRFRIDQLQISYNDDQGTLILTPLLNFQGALAIRPSSQTASVHIQEEENSVFSSMHAGQKFECRPDLDVRMSWENDLLFTMESSFSFPPGRATWKLLADFTKGEIHSVGPNVTMPEYMEVQTQFEFHRFALDDSRVKAVVKTQARKQQGFPLLPDMDLSVSLQGKLTDRTLHDIQNSMAHLGLPFEMTLHTTAKAKKIPTTLAIRALDADFSLNLRDQKLALTGYILLPDLEAKGLVNGRIGSTLPFPLLAQQLKNSLTPIKTLREALTGTFTFDVSSRHSRDFKISFKFDKSQMDRVRISARAAANHFSFEQKGLSIKNLTVDFPFKRTIYLGVLPKVTKKNNAEVWNRPYVENIYTISPFSNRITIESLRMAGQTLSTIQIDAESAGSNFVLNRFAANLLGGSLWGKATLLLKKGALSATGAIELVDLDLNRLSLSTTGDATIRADFRGDLLISYDPSLSSERLLEETNFQFHLTKVGDQTLERLMAFFDPKGEDPSFAQVRGLLQNKTIAKSIRNPKVSMNASHGMLDMEIVLPGVKLFDLTIPIRGFPLKNLLKLPSFKSQIDSVLPLIRMAKYFDVVGIDDHGKFLFLEEKL